MLLPFLIVLIVGSGVVLAHGEPQQTVDGKYRITMTIIAEGNETRMRFFFDDISGGRIQSVNFTVKIKEEDGLFIHESSVLHASEGIGDFVYTFPKAGFYEIFLSFEKFDEPGKVYTPEDWRIWSAGPDGSGRRYPIEPSTIAGFGLAGMAFLIILGNLIIRRKRGFINFDE